MVKASDLFSADRPIQTAAQDKLGRRTFAIELADAISEWKGNDSIVIAINGGWGSGKSSIKNIVLERLRSEPKTCPHILDFNPWQWANQDQLASAFFDELSLTIQRTNRSKKNKEAAAKLKAYQTKLALGSNVYKTFRTALMMGGFLNDPGMLEQAEQLRQVEDGLGKAQKALGEGVDASEAQAKLIEQSLAEMKMDISETLLKLDRPTLVVIDDVDRLSKQEARLLFQLIKANADFPNTVYLVLYQRDIVEKALNEDGYTGQEYLEKIVQLAFDVPLIERTTLDSIFTDKLGEVLGEIAMRRFRKDRWAPVYLNGIREYINDLRDAYRYISTFAFHVKLFSGERAFEVNPIDLIAVEALRVFEPRIYAALPGNKAFLTGNRGLELLRDRGEDRRKEQFASLLRLANQPEPAEALLKELFPSARGESSDRDEWLRDLRICHSHIFDRYLYLSIPTGDISQSDVELILDVSSSRENLVQEFERHQAGGTLNQVIKYLEAYKTTIDIRSSASFVTALFDVGDVLAGYESDMFERPTDYARITILWYVEKEPTYRKRLSTLKKAISGTTGLFLAVNYVSAQERINQEGDRHRIEPTDLKALERLCLVKIRAAADSGQLDGHPRLHYILYRWSEWGPATEVRKWVAQYIMTKEGLVHFAKGLMRPDMWSGQPVMSVDDVKPLITPSRLLSVVRKAELSSDDPTERQIFEAVSKLAAEAKVKPSSEGGTSSDDGED